MSDTGRKPLNFTYAGSGVVLISPLGYLNYAKEFYEAGRSIKSSSAFSPVAYYLLCHALELALKSYLLCNGVPKEELGSKKYRHNLIKILNQAGKRCITNIIPFDKMVIGEIKKANGYYHKKHFEYFEVMKAALGYKNLPDMAVIDLFIEKLLVALEPIVMKAGVNL